MTQPTYPSHAVPPVKRRKVWPWVLGGLAVLLVVCGIGVVAIIASADKALDDLAATPPAATTPAGDGSSTGKPATKAPPAATTIDTDGTHLVPAEVKPGTYRAVVPADSSNCYWARLRGTSGNLDDIIANDNANPGAKLTVTVRASDKAFETTGCGVWTRIAA